MRVMVSFALYRKIFKNVICNQQVQHKAGLIKRGILFLDANFARINFTKVP